MSNKKTKEIAVSVLANFTPLYFGDVLREQCQQKGVSCKIDFGGYDNIAQDSEDCELADIVCVFWDVSSILEQALRKCAEDPAQISHILIEHLKAQIDLILANLKSQPIVIFNKFSKATAGAVVQRADSINQWIDELNQHLYGEKPNNVYLVDIDVLLARCGVDSAVDWRLFYTSRALYTRRFIRSYVDNIFPIVRQAVGLQLKALVLDCDNTLWGGVIAEEGPSNLKMDEYSPLGRVYSCIQHRVRDLSKRGIILCLCTKNDPDIEQEIFGPNMNSPLSRGMFSAIRCNWKAKSENIRSMSAELGIHVNSFLFVDDSVHEIEEVCMAIPEIETFLVPEKKENYPSEFVVVTNRLSSGPITEEDRGRQKMYQDQKAREMAAKGYKDVKSFIEALGTEITVAKNDLVSAPRISQLTQKTNQFELTQLRLSINEVQTYLSSGTADIYSISVSDKFGSAGITGACFVRQVNKEVVAIEGFMLSCRILRRDIEYAFLGYLLGKLKTLGIKRVDAEFCLTDRNKVAKSFLPVLGFQCTSDDKGVKKYKVNLENNNLPAYQYIGIRENEIY